MWLQSPASMSCPSRAATSSASSEQTNAPRGSGWQGTAATTVSGKLSETLALRLSLGKREMRSFNISHPHKSVCCPRRVCFFGSLGDGPEGDVGDGKEDSPQQHHHWVANRHRRQVRVPLRHQILKHVKKNLTLLDGWQSDFSLLLRGLNNFSHSAESCKCFKLFLLITACNKSRSSCFIPTASFCCFFHVFSLRRQWWLDLWRWWTVLTCSWNYWSVTRVT